MFTQLRKKRTEIQACKNAESSFAYKKVNRDLCLQDNLESHATCTNAKQNQTVTMRPCQNQLFFLKKGSIIWGVLCQISLFNVLNYSHSPKMMNNNFPVCILFMSACKNFQSSIYTLIYSHMNPNDYTFRSNSLSKPHCSYLAVGETHRL